MADLLTNTYEPPAWLNKSFIEVALREGLRRGSLNVNNVNINPATNVGDNYLSQMFRASANVESRRKGKENLSLIIKSMPIGEEVGKFVNDGNFFSRETEMLLNTLPTMQKILNEVGEQKICADLYYQQGEPDNLIIVEDLCVKGYKTPDRLKCLDLAHSFLIAESLAVFHAASLVAVQKNPKIKETYDKSCWQEHNDETITKFFKEGFTTMIECLEEWKTLPSFYVEKLEKLREKAKAKLYKATARNDDEINVLNHADPWTTNFMIKYSNHLPISCVFVDFQLSCYNSFAFDLLYFIFTSTRNDIRLNNLDDILLAYQKKLVETCKKLNYPLDLSFKEVKDMFHKRLFLGFFIVLVILPFMIVPSKDVKELNDYLNSTEHSNNMIDNAFFKETIESTFPFFLEQGMFD